jgi:hypothetical protein
MQGDFKVLVQKTKSMVEPPSPEAAPKSLDEVYLNKKPAVFNPKPEVYLLPKKYANAKTSDLDISVKHGKNSFTLELKD